MDSLAIPKTEREKRATRLACLLSLEYGSVPYARDLGVQVDLDGPSPVSAQRAFALAAEQAENKIPGVRVTDGYVSAGVDGSAKIYLKVEDR